MKLLFISLLTFTALHSFAAEDMASKNVIESSRQFQAIKRNDSRNAVRTTCSNYTVVSSVDLESTAAYTIMVTETVMADCISLPADFPLKQKLLSLVTYTRDLAKKKSDVRVEAVKIIVTSLGLDEGSAN